MSSLTKEKIEEKYQKKMAKNKKKDIIWSTRISKEDNDILLSCGQFMEQSGWVKEANIYNINRFALKSLIMTLTKIAENQTKQSSNFPCQKLRLCLN